MGSSVRVRASSLSAHHRATRIRRRVLRMFHRAQAPFVGSALSIVDVLTVLYLDVLRFDPKQPQQHIRDRFILSKGHAGAALYATLAEFDFFTHSSLQTNAVALAGYTTQRGLPGVEVGSAAPGHGLGVAVGAAIGLDRGGGEQRVFVVVGGGECASGSLWESVLLAARLGLDNLVVFVEHDRPDGGRTDLAERWRSCGWAVREVDGHDYAGMSRVLARIPFRERQPSAVVGATRYGAGVSFMEDNNEWRGRELDAEHLNRALAELAEG